MYTLHVKCGVCISFIIIASINWKIINIMIDGLAKGR